MRLRSVFVVAAVSIVAVPGLAVAAGPSISLISVSTGGEQANVFTREVSSTPDGRYVVFATEADNLVTPDAGSRVDVFLRDTVAGTTTRITNDSLGGPPNGESVSPVISEDGRYVAFASNSTDFVSQQTFGFMAYVYDRQTDQYTLVSVNTAGSAANSGMGSSQTLDMSPDGRYIAFVSKATNLSPFDHSRSIDVYVRDLQKGVTRLMSVNVHGNAAGHSRFPQVSSDGQLVAFQSGSAKLVPHDTNAFPDAFVRDRVAKTTERVSVSGDGTQANGDSPGGPAISGGGRFVAFSSTADNLAGEDNNATADVFLHDRLTGATKLISKTSDGVAGGGGIPVVSLDGRFIAFASLSALVPEDTNPTRPDVYLWDRPNQQMSLISQPLSGVQEAAGSEVREVSADGRFVYFLSDADNLANNDTNLNSDLFVLDRTG